MTADKHLWRVVQEAYKRHQNVVTVPIDQLEKMLVNYDVLLESVDNAISELDKIQEIRND